MLGFLHGMILLAGVGAAALLKLAPNALARTFVGVLLIVGIAHLGWQAYLGSYKFYADSRNPYVYAHPTTDVFAMVGRVEAIAEVHEDGYNMSIQVVCPEHDYWPLPWYLRFFPNVVWRDKVTDDVVSSPLIIASPKVEQELLTKLYQLPPPGEKNLYVPLFDTYTELRPQIELRGYVTKDLWDRFKQ
jgi:predicted membrane-bound mannosyltransferase